MQAVHGNACFAYPTVNDWCTKFKNGGEETNDKPRPDALGTAATDRNVACAEGLIGENRLFAIRGISENKVLSSILCRQGHITIFYSIMDYSSLIEFT